MADRPVVLVGCGRLGSALVEGWLKFGPVTPGRLIVLTPSEKAAVEAARAQGARINPDPDALGEAGAVVLAVKPARWREAAAPLGRLAPDAVVVSLMAGVQAGSLAAALARPVARVMPTTGVAQGQGVAALWSADPAARDRARDLFVGVADVVELTDEAQMDAATAAAGSAPAFLLAHVEALAEAAATRGLPREAALRLVRGALRSAAAGAAEPGDLQALIARVASPGGTTRAGLDASGRLIGEAARAAIDAAVDRARELGSEQSA